MNWHDFWMVARTLLFLIALPSVIQFPFAFDNLRDWRRPREAHRLGAAHEFFFSGFLFLSGVYMVAIVIWWPF